MQLAAPESLAVSSNGNGVVLDGAELPLLTPSCRKELARFSSTFLSPWHKSSQSPYLFDGRTPEFSIAGSARKLAVVEGAGIAGAAISAAGCGDAAGAALGCG